MKEFFAFWIVCTFFCKSLPHEVLNKCLQSIYFFFAFLSFSSVFQWCYIHLLLKSRLRNVTRMPTWLAACPFKCTHRLLDEEEKRCRYIQSASGFATGSTRRRLIIETDTARWEAFVRDVFKGEQTSVMPVLSKGRLWYLGLKHL